MNGKRFEHDRRDLLKRYGVALGLAALALFLREVLPFREGTSVYQLPLVAVLLGAWYGGRGPGLLASAICVVGVWYLFLPPVRSFQVAPDHVLPLLIFIGLCLLVTLFTGGRRRDEQELRASEQRFHALVQFSFDVYWETDARHRFTRQEFSEQLRDAPERGSEIGKTRWEIPYVEPDEDGWREHRATLDAHLPFRDFELARPAPDGGRRYVSVSGIPAFDEAGRFAGYRGVGRHITERKVAEAERRAAFHSLRESERRLEAAQRLAHVGWWERDYATSGVSLSDEACRIFGVEPADRAQWEGRWRSLIHPEDRDKAVAANEMALEGVARYEVEYRVVRPDGGIRVVHSQGDVIRDETGRPVRQFGVMQDITDLRRAEEDLRQSEAYLAEAQRLSHAGSWALDVAAGKYLYTSEESDRIWGFDPHGEKPSRQAVSERIHPDDRAQWKRNIEKSLVQKEDSADEYRLKLPDGTVRHLHTIRHPILDAAGNVVKIVGTSIDITERKRAEEERERLRRLQEEMAHANRVITIGELTASIAHEVNQPLGAMVANAGACARWLGVEPPQVEKARRALDSIVADGRRASDIVARIRALTKRQAPRKDRLDINRRIVEVLSIADRDLRDNDIAIETRLDDGLPPVTGDRVQLHQVLLNLVVNAIDAMGEVNDRPRRLTIVSRPDGAGAVTVEVRDSGTGLDPHDAERLFEAFYTTKPDGMGVGLSISRSIIEAHGGRLWASPNEPHGANFGFSLPVGKGSP